MVPPIPEAELEDLSMRVFSETFLIFCLEVTLLLRIVVINLQVVSAVPKPLNWRVLDPLVRNNLLAAKGSVVPSFLIKVYLSSSNGKNTSPSPAVIAAVWLLLIEVLNCLLTTKLELTKSTAWIFCLGKIL